MIVTKPIGEISDPIARKILHEQQHAALPAMHKLLQEEEAIVDTLKLTPGIFPVTWHISSRAAELCTDRSCQASVEKLRGQVTCGECHVGLWNLYFITEESYNNKEKEEVAIFCADCSVTHAARRAFFLHKHTREIRQEFLACRAAIEAHSI